MGQRKSTKSRSLVIQQVHLSATQIRRMSKPRIGFVDPAQQLLTLVREIATEVVPAGFDFDLVLAKLAQYQAMAPEVHHKKLDFETAADTQLQLGSEAWQLVLLAYKYAKAAAPTNPKAAAAVAVFEAFMKGHRKPKQPTTPTTPSTPAAP